MKKAINILIAIFLLVIVYELNQVKGYYFLNYRVLTFTPVLLIVISISLVLVAIFEESD